MTMRPAFGAMLAGVALALALPMASATAQTVGAAAAVNPTSTGTPPGGSARELKAGTDIVSRERIRTSGGGSLQVMFNDKSTMTIGPNSDVMIDEFVYNPGASGGDFAASLTKGALRFVGGQISHTDGAKINTPVATLVVRGGAAFVSHSQKCETKKDNRDCTTIVCTGGDCRVSSRVDRRTFRLRINQAVEVGALGAVEYNVRSVTLNDVAKGGDGGIVSGKKADANARFNGRQEVDRIVVEQKPEPRPPAPPQ